MAELSGIRTLKQVVDGLLFKSSEPKENYMRFYQMAIDAYRDLRLFHSTDKVWLKCVPDSLNRIDFPSDMLQFVSLSVPINGLLYTLTREDLIVPTVTGTAPNETLDATDGEGVDVNKGYYQAYWARGGVNQEGYFTVDYNNRKIILSNVDRTEVVLCYVSNGVSSTNSYVPVTAVPAIEAYIMWKDKFYQRDTLPNIDYYFKQYEYECDRLDVLTEPTLDEIADAIRSTYTRLPKR